MKIFKSVIEERREKTKALRESLSDVKKETDDILRDKEVKEAALENLLHEIGSTKERECHGLLYRPGPSGPNMHPPPPPRTNFHGCQIVP